MRGLRFEHIYTHAHNPATDIDSHAPNILRYTALNENIENFYYI